MMSLKACPRCEKGDMYRDQDDCKHCIQCGYVARTTNPAAEMAARWFDVVKGGDEPGMLDSLRRLTSLAG